MTMMTVLLVAATVTGSSALPFAQQRRMQGPGGQQLQNCEYTTYSDLIAALVSAGCDLTDTTCSERCAEAYEPIQRECRNLMVRGQQQQGGRGQQGGQQQGGRGQQQGSSTSFDMFAFGQACDATLHPDSGDTETARECHDGEDNDGDGTFDCDDSDCCYTRQCQREPQCIAYAASGSMGETQNGDCGSTAVLPVMLSCSHWTSAAETGRSMDGFCSSTCYDGLSTTWATCSSDMSSANHDALAPLAAQLGSCAADPTVNVCDIDRLNEVCGSPTAAAQDCTDACTAALDSQEVACTTSYQWPLWSPALAACAATIESRACSATTTDFLTFVDSSCCRDVDCTTTPQTCQPECASSFMSFYSRCGAIVFGADARTQRTMENFNRKCARVAGRDVVAAPENPTSPDTHAQLNGPDYSDPCSETVTCSDCSGECGWCASADGVSAAVMERVPNGGWCSSECVTTQGECKAANGGGH